MNDDNDSDIPEALETLVAPHVSSFDYFLDQGLADIVDKIEPTEVRGFDPLPRAPSPTAPRSLYGCFVLQSASRHFIKLLGALMPTFQRSYPHPPPPPVGHAT